MTTLLNLIAAIALLVWGTHIVRTGVLRVYGAGLRQVLRRSMNGQATAFLAGLGVTGLLQSSTATALLTSSFVAQGLLTTAAEGDLTLVDAAARGYSEHVQLTDEEIHRLPGILTMKPLWLACIQYRESVRSGHTPTLDDGWPSWDVDRSERNQRIAARAIAALR